jgi:hypothetical protein
MKLITALLPLLLVAGLVWLLVQRTRLTSRERAELANLRIFKDRVRDAALDELEVDATSSFARIVLDDVRQVDAANRPDKEL